MRNGVIFDGIEFPALSMPIDGAKQSTLAYQFGSVIENYAKAVYEMQTKPGYGALQGDVLRGFAVMRLFECINEAVATKEGEHR